MLDWNYIFDTEGKIAKMLKDRFPEATILPTLGNHDTNPIDNFTGKFSSN